MSVQLLSHILEKLPFISVSRAPIQRLFDKISVDTRGMSESQDGVWWKEGRIGWLKGEGMEAEKEVVKGQIRRSSD